MKYLLVWIFTLALASLGPLSVRAQAADTIWLEAPGAAYQAGDTVVVTVNARSATRVQGFTFQIRYDSACLKPLDAASPIAGMNGLKLPQQAGLVDASFASTVPQTANGVLAEVRFLSLGTCQTQLVLESAALAIRTSSGFAAPLSGVSTSQQAVTLDIGPSSGGAAPATQPAVGTPLPLDVKPVVPPNLLLWVVVTAGIMLLLGFGLFALLRLTRKSSPGPR